MAEWVDHLEDQVRQRLYGDLSADQWGMPIVNWLSYQPGPLRRSIFMLLHGYEEERRKSRAQGVANRRRRKGGVG